MTLYEYTIQLDDDELTVADDVYDEWFYLYPDFDNSVWDEYIAEICKELTVRKIDNNVVFVNLSEVIEKHLEQIAKANLFHWNDVDMIMMGIGKVFAGYVGENWLKKFMEALVND